jgi:hypothetical protein
LQVKFSGVRSNDAGAARATYNFFLKFSGILLKLVNASMHEFRPLEVRNPIHIGKVRTRWHPCR